MQAGRASTQLHGACSWLTLILAVLEPAGYAEPGVLMALMGGSGAGKT
jgi:hypothetical protein